MPKSRIECFLLERTDFFVRKLRRYALTNRTPCTAGRISHDACVTIDIVSFACDDELEGSDFEAPPPLDPNWPTKCAYCGTIFQSHDPYQAHDTRLYRTPSGRLTPTDASPPGSLWYADWLPWKGPDGKSLMVMLPDNIWWCPDGPGKNEDLPWKRSGEVPKVTVTPSILTPSYHGFLTDGFLEEC